MYKRKTIDKAKIIEALKTEPLFPGSWISINQDIGSGRVEDCPVCAVGSVIRSILYPEIKNYASSNFALERACMIAGSLTGGVTLSYEFKAWSKEGTLTEEETFQRLLENFGPWSALSCYFEFLAEPILFEHEQLIEQYFDKEFNIDVYDTECDKLLEQVKKTVTPKLVSMVEEYLPTRVKLPEDWAEVL